MPKPFQQNASAPLPTENLFNNLKTAKMFFSAKSQIFESTEMKNLFALFEEKNIKETQLNQFDKMKKMTDASRVNKLKLFDIPSFESRLTNELKSNEQQIQLQIKNILENNQHKSELRSIASRNVQLIGTKQQLGVQEQLVEAFSEEIIDEEEAQKYKSLINAEIDRFYSGPVRELYQQDFQAILEVGIAKSDLPYLKDLSQLLDETISSIIKQAIKDYQKEKENDHANHWMEIAERQIAEQAQAEAEAEAEANRQRIDFTSSVADHFVRQTELDEIKPLPALYTADSAEAVYELLLNGANPILESKDLDSIPLTQLFASRYIIEQDLNYVVGISLPSIQTRLNPKFGEKVLLRQFSEEKKQLKTNLNNQIETLTAETEWQPELKIHLADHIQALHQEAKEQKFKLKNDLESKIEALYKETKALTPELTLQLSHPSEQLKPEADGRELALENNAALIDAHIKAIVLRKDDAQPYDYPDISGKERFLQTFNNCKQEIKKLQQTQLTENCSAYDFLTKDFPELSVIKAKTLKSVMNGFPEYKPLLHMQNDLLNNYRLVQGPRQVTPVTELKPAIILNDSEKEQSVAESKISETQGTPLNIKNSTETGQLIQPFNRTRFKNAAFFNASVQSKPRSISEKVSEGPSRLNGLLFSAIAPSDFSVVKKKSVDRTICYAK